MGVPIPELTDDESQEKIISAVEVKEELDELKDVVYRKLKEILTSLNTLRESVRLIENDKEESWEAISHKVSTLVEDSVGSLSERLTELEHTVQSQRTTPVTEDDVLNMETWSTLEQVIWSELGRCGVKFALVLSGLTLQILSNGQPEILQSFEIKKRRRCAI